MGLLEHIGKLVNKNIVTFVSSQEVSVQKNRLLFCIEGCSMHDIIVDGEKHYSLVFNQLYVHEDVYKWAGTYIKDTIEHYINYFLTHSLIDIWNSYNLFTYSCNNKSISLEECAYQVFYDWEKSNNRSTTHPFSICRLLDSIASPSFVDECAIKIKKVDILDEGYTICYTIDGYKKDLFIEVSYDEVAEIIQLEFDMDSMSSNQIDSKDKIARILWIFYDKDLNDLSHKVEVLSDKDALGVFYEYYDVWSHTLPKLIVCEYDVSVLLEGI
jgi:hypothetical protein